MNARVKSPPASLIASDNATCQSVSIRRSPNLDLAAASWILFASGAAALIFQIIWVRQLSLVVGIDVFAVTLAVSSFFAGLAAGSFLFGHSVERTSHPMRLYALLELSIALTGLISTLLLTHTPKLFVALEQTSGLLAWSVPFLLVGIPATFMGGTLPVVVKAFIRPDEQLGVKGGRLYAANTMGAIAGTLMTAYLLIPKFGIFGAAVVAATLNTASAGLALFYHHRAVVDHTVLPAAQTEPSIKRKRIPLGLVLYGVAGGIALGYEVAWSQIVVQWTSTRSFAFATVLAVYLAGLAIGSRLGSWRSEDARDHWGCFAVLITAAGMIALLQMLSLGRWLDQWQIHAATMAYSISGSEELAMSGRFLLAAGCVLFVPALLLGAAFPFALQLLDDRSVPGRTSGRILAANTLGGIAGTLITGFLLVPTFGVERSLAVLAMGAGMVGAVACCRARPWSYWIVGTICFVTVLACSTVSSEQFGKLLASRRKGKLIYQSSGAGGTVAVIEQGHQGRKFRRLYIQGVSNSGDSMTSLRYMRLQALLPLIIHGGDPKSVLVIGLGTGITAGSLLSYEGLERRICAELLPEVVAAASYFEGNERAVSDPRLEIRRADGRHELLRRSETYDLITLEPPPPSASGVANLYSVEFYQLAKARLEPKGLVAQWLPLPTQNDADTRSLVRSFLDVFPHASLWSTELHEMLLVGAPDPLQLDVQTIKHRFEQPGILKSLGDVGVKNPAALLATYVCDRTVLEEYARNALPVTDDRPRIEYGPWTVPGEFPRTFGNLIALRSEPQLLNADEQFQADVRRERSTLNLFYAASIAAYEGDRPRWETAMNAAFHADPNNVYYRWFGNGGGGSPP